MKHHRRSFEEALFQRLQEPVKYIQVILGPRQVGKTSGVQNLLHSKFKKEQYDYFLCEEAISSPDWFEQKVQSAIESDRKIVVFDEIQKIDRWSDKVKLAWDRQKQDRKSIHWVLLGSSSLELGQGLNESLAGRFEILPVHHWSAEESMQAFGLTLDDYISYGGYPGSYSLLSDKKRLRDYVLNAIFEAVVGKDILRHASVKKPALFRQTFALANSFPAQEISYNKLLGQLQDAGNVDQIKHYLELYSQAFLLRLVFKKTKSKLSRTSSPKLVPTAPIFHWLFSESELTTEDKGRAFEAIVGNRLAENFDQVHFWREGNDEIDFVVTIGKAVYGVEVKSTSKKRSSTDKFRKAFKDSRVCFVTKENYLNFEKDPIVFLKKYST